jgi:anti-sigma regulatory factor (Ser/Thr protein kinase)
MDTTSMSNVFSIRVAADVEQLATLRAFIDQQAERLGVESSACYDLVLAANEMATNIVLHGYRGRSGTIEIDMRRSGDAIEIQLRDQAPAFDPTRAPAPDLTLPLHKRPLGGMGIHVTRQMMDDIRHRALPQGGNELTLVKRGIVATRRKE